MHVFARFCTFVYTVCTWDTWTPAIKYWPSTTQIFYSWTLYYIPLTLWYTILSCTSFSIPQKTCISRPYCINNFLLRTIIDSILESSSRVKLLSGAVTLNPYTKEQKLWNFCFNYQRYLILFTSFWWKVNKKENLVISYNRINDGI